MEEPGVERCKRRQLLDISVIAFCAAICGAGLRVHLEMFAKSKEEWLRTVVVQRLGQVKWKGNLSILPFVGQLGQTPGTMVVGSVVEPVGGLCEGAGVLPYRVARNAQLSSDLA